ncbi:hypothetical protein ACHAAC_02540 [Aeromicrobium sp. CF4.19]|uniref:hypothetical protein n=1 Tax=Aeromicrobium sp. CF4.19 TaxID=3373082 RepID=UPI003EE697EF
MSDLDWITAATLAMPGRAHLSHASRLQALGLTIADLLPIRFTVRGDLHLDLAGIFLHRTVALPPLDDVGVTPAAAFIQMCAEGRLIDVVVAGDWLLANEHTTIMAIDQLARLQDWRPGALMSVVHAALVRRGYDGPPPVFGGAWFDLFEPIALPPGS